MLVYHGTALAHLPSIKLHGILPGGGAGADKWASAQGNHKFEGNEPRVYISKARDFATQFAAYTADLLHSAPVLLKLQIDSLDDWHQDEGSAFVPAYWSHNPVPVSAIVEAEPLPASVIEKYAKRTAAFFNGDDPLQLLSALLGNNFA